MQIHQQHSLCKCIRRTKKIRGTKLSLQQEVGHFDLTFPFHSVLSISMSISGPNFTCLIRVQPWTHRPIYSHNQSTTCWTQGMTFNPFLHCPKHRQLRDAYTIIRQWGQVRGTPQQQRAPSVWTTRARSSLLAALISIGIEKVVLGNSLRKHTEAFWIYSLRSFIQSDCTDNLIS